MIVMGRFVAPYGLQGWLRVHAFGDDPSRWKEASRCWMSPDPEQPNEDWVLVQCETLKPHSSGPLIKVLGIDDRGSAESLCGHYLGILHEDLPRPKSGEYYWADLIGLHVVNLSEEPLGSVSTLLESGANQVLVVVDGDCQRMLPFVDSVIKKVDLIERSIQVDWGRDW